MTELSVTEEMLERYELRGKFKNIDPAWAGILAGLRRSHERNSRTSPRPCITRRGGMMDKGNPAITNNAFCVLAMKDKHSGFFGGFDVVGPFETEKEASYWGARNISMTPFDNPHWIVAPMTSPKKE